MLANASDPRSRVNAHDFSRDCKLTPELLVVLLLFMVGDSNRRGYRHILDAFWDECTSHGVPLPTETPVTASAFCQARAKPSDDLLRHLPHDAVAKMESTFRSASHWRGRRVFAVDGCKLDLQRSDELDARFGRPECGHVPQATLSALVNVMTRIPTDVVIGPYGACERQLLLDHLGVLDAGDILVLDRGYPSHEVLRILLDAEIDFLVRVPAAHSFDAVTMFQESGGDDYRVVIPPASDVRCGAGAIELRAVKPKSPKGDESFYLTSLRPAHLSRAQIAELYHCVGGPRNSSSSRSRLTSINASSMPAPRWASGRRSWPNPSSWSSPDSCSPPPRITLTRVTTISPSRAPCSRSPTT